MEKAKEGGIRLQEIFTQYGDDFLTHHKLSYVQLKAMKAIEGCATEAMGYHQYYCDQCGHRQIAYNSCRNRHCPHCQWLKQELWIDRIKSQLLPVRYFHVVFTLPESINSYVLLNHGLLYNILFESAWHALRQAGNNPSFLGADIGAIAILHTWGQTLCLHPHIHLLIPAGGLDSDGWQWINTSKKFFVPVKALSKMFRAKFIALLSQAIEQNKLTQGNSQIINEWEGIKTKLYKTDWVVYCKKCWAGPAQVVNYLGRYTHRVAISESRILNMDNDTVSFRWKDYRSKNERKTMDLPAQEFIRRFMLHVLPQGFYKIRYFGILAVANRQRKLIQCFRLLGCIPSMPVFAGMSTEQILEKLTGHQINRCPVCNKGVMRLLGPPGELE
jgi:hypothetical protein